MTTDRAPAGTETRPAAHTARRRLASPWSDDVLDLFAEATDATIPAKLLSKAAAYPDDVAYRFKHFGVYEEMTFTELVDDVAAVCLGLVSLGLERGDRMAIMADPCIEWPISDLAGMSAGAIVYGVYPTSSVTELQYLLDHGGATVFVAENQEYVDKVLEVADALPALRHIIVADTRALWAYEDPRLIPLDEVRRLGRERQQRRPHEFAALVRGGDPDDPAAIVYTSGTSGMPKGATITHRAVCSFASTWLPFPEIRGGQHRVVSALPLAHLLERSMTVVSPLLMDVVVHFGESAEDLPATLREVAPTIYVTVPRYWEKFASQILVSVQTSTRFKRRVFDLAARVARRYVDARHEGRSGTPWLRLAYRLGWWAAFRPVLEKVGFLKLRVGVTAAAPMPPEVMNLWHKLGVDLREGYGQTEIGWISVQAEAFPQPGTVGRPYPWMTVELDEDNEILVACQTPFHGYWRDREATAASTDGDFVRTGDVGEITAEGELKIVDRKKDIVITAGGKNLSPLQIESALKASPYISEVIVFADGRKYPVALVELDFETVSEWARANGVVYTGFTGLARNDQVNDLIAREVAAGNSHLARVEQVKRFAILDQEFDPESEDDPVTPTRKVKRRQMYERFKEVIEGLYADADLERIAAVGDDRPRGE